MSAKFDHDRYSRQSEARLDDLSSEGEVEDEDDDLNDDVGEVGESIEIDAAALDAAFTSGLQSRGPHFLHELQRRVSRDEQLTGFSRKIVESLQLLITFIGEGHSLENSARYANISLRELCEDFGVPEDALNRVGVLAFEIESSSPDSTLARTDREIAGDGEASQGADAGAPFVDIPSRAGRSGNGAQGARVRLLSGTSEEDLEGEGGSYEDDFEIEDDGRYDAEESGNVSDGSQGGDYAEDEHHVVTTAGATDLSQFAAEPRRLQSAPVSRKTGVAASVDEGPRAISTPRDNGGKPRAVTASRGRSKPATASWIVKRKWVLGEKIGTGSFGEVYQGMNDEGRLFAVKRLHIAGQRNVVDTLTNEIQLMRDYAHPNIVGYFGAEVDEKEGVVNIFQEWVPGGSLAHLLGRFGAFKEGAVANYTRQMLHGLNFLHSHGIIHRDIKGGNVLVDEFGNVKLADFGASTKLNLDLDGNTVEIEGLEVKGTLKGTPYFMAPEVLGESRYGRKGDIWAVGCTMVQMLTAQPPWKNHNLSGLMQLFTLLQKWEGPPTYPAEHVSAECRECIEWCFQRDEDARPSAEALLNCNFMQIRDDLEDSSGESPMKHANSSTLSDGADLDDSGVMTELRKQMVRLAQSTESLPLQPSASKSLLRAPAPPVSAGAGNSGTGGTLKDVEKQLLQRQLARQAENVHRTLQRGDDEHAPADDHIRQIKRAAVNPYARSSAGVPPGINVASPQRSPGLSTSASKTPTYGSSPGNYPPGVTVPKRPVAEVTRASVGTPTSGSLARKSALPKAAQRPPSGSVSTKGTNSHGLSSARDTEGLTPMSPYSNTDDSPLQGSISRKSGAGGSSPAYSSRASSAESEKWTCLNAACGKINVSHGEDDKDVLPYCAHCSVVRGSSGRSKDVKASITRR